MSIASVVDALEFDEQFGLPHPRWNAIMPRVDALPASDHQAVWYAMVRRWMQTLGGSFRPSAKPLESQSLIVLGADPSRLQTLSTTVTSRLDHMLPGLRSADTVGPVVVISPPTLDQFYDYLAAVTHEDESLGCAGFCVQADYVHVVVTPVGPEYTLGVLAHELTHAMLAFHTLPAWLDEGLAQTVDELVTGEPRLFLTHEAVRAHIDLWTAHSLDAFWTGESFAATWDEEYRSYELALVLTKNIIRELGVRTAELVKDASRTDAGAAAIESYLGRGLVDLVAEFLGPGDWSAPSVGT